MNFITVQFPIIVVSIAYALGIFIGNYIIHSHSYFLFSLVTLVLIIVLEKYLKRRNHSKTYLLLLSIILFSFFINSARVNNVRDNSTELKSEVIITKLFTSNSKYQNCIVKNINNSQKYLARIRLYDNTDFKVGTILFIDAKIKQLNYLDIPNNFNFSKYLERRNVYKKIEITNYVNTLGKHSTSREIDDIISNSKLEIGSKGLMKALVLGRKDGITDEVMESFSDSGIMHLLALSGLHIGILTLVLSFLLRPLKLLKRGKLIRSIVLVILLWYYAYITGFSSSIVRATIMFSAIVVGNGMNRPVNIYNSLAIAALTLLIINPNYLFDVGFQLSFSAVIGIIWMFPMLSKFWQPKPKIVKYFWSLLVVSVSAQIATFPFTVYYFHKFSGLFFIANIIEIPLITILLMLSYLMIILMLFGIEISLLNYIYDKTVLAIEYVSMQISTFESMIFEDIFINKFTVILLFSLVISIVIILQYRRAKYLFLLLIIIITVQILSFTKMTSTKHEETLMMAKNEIFIQKGFQYKTNLDNGIKLFSNYSLANQLVLNDTIVNSIFYFDDNYYLRLTSNINSNPIVEEHYILIDNTVKKNPEIFINKNTLGVIYSGYKKSSSKLRWNHYCTRNSISFIDTNEKMYRVDVEN